jgi:ABC-2 type transport system ATP-binding protein
LVGPNQVSATGTVPGSGDPYNHRHESPPNRPVTAMSASEVVVAGLRKRFGTTRALDGMSFTVGPGLVTGFVGPNGAGKSTTLRVILGLDTPDAGEAWVAGRPYHRLRRPLRHVGALLDAGAVEPGRSARNHLLWLARSQGITARRVDEVIELVGLSGVARRKAGGFSLGMRQRLGIAAALLGDPPVLLLDEPFNGMDPDGIIWTRTLLRSLAGEGRVVLVSSHLMGELEDMASHVIVAGRGKVIADAAVADLLAAVAGKRMVLRCTSPDRAARVLSEAGGAITRTGPDTLCVAGLSSEQIVAALARDQVRFSELSAERASLEDAYLQLTRGQVDYQAEPPAGAAR